MCNALAQNAGSTCDKKGYERSPGCGCSEKKGILFVSSSSSGTVSGPILPSSWKI